MYVFGWRSAADDILIMLMIYRQKLLCNGTDQPVEMLSILATCSSVDKAIVISTKVSYDKTERQKLQHDQRVLHVDVWRSTSRKRFKAAMADLPGSDFDHVQPPGELLSLNHIMRTLMLMTTLSQLLGVLMTAFASAEAVRHHTCQHHVHVMHKVKTR